MSNNNTPSWYKKTAEFAQPSKSRSIGQIFTSLVPHLSLLLGSGFIYRFQGYNPWLLVPMTIFTSLFFVRVFIIFHDCGHQAFWKSRSANNIWGHILGILTFTPYNAWKRSHGIHHAHSGDLDHRGIGDVWTITVEEYRKLSPAMKLWYRIYRHPLMLLIISPFFLFLVLQRLPKDFFKPVDHVNLHISNLAMLAMVLGLGFLFGWGFLLVVYLPMLLLSFTMGVWLFYVQHQFDPTYWSRTENWSKYDAALHGSSYYKLPKFFQFFSGNIGFHHIHHARPRIPNYNLEKCCKSIPELDLKDAMTFLKSLKCANLSIWDEESRRLISFKELRIMNLKPSVSQ